ADLCPIHTPPTRPPPPPLFPYTTLFRSPLAHLRVHPGQLDARLPRREQPVGGILLDPVARALAMPADDLLEHGEERLERPVVVRRGEVGADRLDVPERRVHGVVLGRLARVRGPIREHAAVDESGER